MVLYVTKIMLLCVRLHDEQSKKKKCTCILRFKIALSTTQTDEVSL